MTAFLDILSSVGNVTPNVERIGGSRKGNKEEMRHASGASELNSRRQRLSALVHRENKQKDSTARSD
jgi:hypothetical protein